MTLKRIPGWKFQVILRLDQSDKEKLSAQNSAMSAARSMADSGSVSPDQRRLVMELYRLTAQIKVFQNSDSTQTLEVAMWNARHNSERACS